MDDPKSELDRKDYHECALLAGMLITLILIIIAIGYSITHTVLTS